MIHIISDKPRKGTYFVSGMQYAGFEENNCFDCLNYRAIDTKQPFCKADKGEGFGCTITDMFHNFQNDMTEQMRQTLIKDYICPMRLIEKDAKLRQSELYKRIEQENAQLKAGYIQEKLQIIESEE